MLYAMLNTARALFFGKIVHNLKWPLSKNEQDAELLPFIFSNTIMIYHNSNDSQPGNLFVFFKSQIQFSNVVFCIFLTNLKNLKHLESSKSYELSINLLFLPIVHSKMYHLKQKTLYNSICNLIFKPIEMECQIYHFCTK